MNKKWFIVSLILTVAVIGGWLLKAGQSKTKSYYSGDAIEYNGQLVIGSANTGSLEIFKFVDGKLINAVKLAAPLDAEVRSHTYNDVVFNQEGGQLYVYASAGSTLYKYDFSDLSNLSLINSVRDTTWDWLGHLDKGEGRIISAGSKATKILNYDLQVVDSFPVVNASNPYNVRLAGRFIFNFNGVNLDIFDRDWRQIKNSLPVTANIATGNKQVYFDAPANMLYVLDDARLARMNPDGDVYKTLSHDSRFGYDVVPSAIDNNYIYIANGNSVAKLNKNDFTFAAGFENRDLKISSSWAMGLKLVPTAKGEVLVVFNNSNILVLDKNLKPLATVLATEDEARPQSLEALSLTVNQGSGQVWDEITVNGSGFQPGEDITLAFAEVNYQAQADDSGRFSAAVLVPASAQGQGTVVIKAQGQKSNLTYSTTFNVTN